MYQCFVQLSDDSYIEITTRLFDGKEKVVLALRGTQNTNTPALASVVIDDSKLKEFSEKLQDLIAERNGKNHIFNG